MRKSRFTEAQIVHVLLLPRMPGDGHQRVILDVHRRVSEAGRDAMAIAA
jgi:hypothetical protein